MKVWELEEGKEYVHDDCLYKVVDSVLVMKHIKESRYSTSQMSYNYVLSIDFTEYEPPVDWSKVEVDTKVLVRCSGDNGGRWGKRHFAKYEHGKIYTWDVGQTSFTVGDDKLECTSWEQVKLYHEQ